MKQPTNVIPSNRKIMRRTCAICLERIAENKMYGILENCDHTFCLSCIRRWRSSNQQNRLMCPQCRTLSHVMVPSKKWFTSQEEKEGILNNKLEEWAQKPCRFFRKGLGFCRYGSSCRFLHEQDPNLPWEDSNNNNQTDEDSQSSLIYSHINRLDWTDVFSVDNNEFEYFIPVDLENIVFSTSSFTYSESELTAEIDIQSENAWESGLDDVFVDSSAHNIPDPINSDVHASDVHEVVNDSQDSDAWYENNTPHMTCLSISESYSDDSEYDGSTASDQSTDNEVVVTNEYSSEGIDLPSMNDESSSEEQEVCDSLYSIHIESDVQSDYISDSIGSNYAHNSSDSFDEANYLFSDSCNETDESSDESSDTNFMYTNESDQSSSDSYESSINNDDVTTDDIPPSLDEDLSSSSYVDSDERDMLSQDIPVLSVNDLALRSDVLGCTNANRNRTTPRKRRS